MVNCQLFVKFQTILFCIEMPSLLLLWFLLYTNVKIFIAIEMNIFVVLQNLSYYIFYLLL